MTDQELQDMGLTRELFTEWTDMMRILLEEISDAEPKITRRDGNKIQVGDLTIAGSFVNHEHVDCEVMRDKDQILVVKNEKKPYRTCAAVLAIVVAENL